MLGNAEGQLGVSPLTALGISRITLVTITGTFTTGDGSPAQGEIVATLSEPIINGPEILEPIGIRGILDATGMLESPLHGPYMLAANDDPETTPSGSTYEFVIELDGEPPRTFNAVIPYTALDGVIDISELEPT